MNKKDFDRDSNLSVKIKDSPLMLRADMSILYMKITLELQPEVFS